MKIHKIFIIVNFIFYTIFFNIYLGLRSKTKRKELLLEFPVRRIPKSLPMTASPLGSREKPRQRRRQYSRREARHIPGFRKKEPRASFKQLKLQAPCSCYKDFVKCHYSSWLSQRPKRRKKKEGHGQVPYAAFVSEIINNVK